VKRCQEPKTKLRPLGYNCSDKSGSWRRRPFTDLYLKLTAGVEIQTGVAIMMAQSTAHIYISATAEKMEKPLATMFPVTQLNRASAHELWLLP
jgi:hypothetical protein